MCEPIYFGNFCRVSPVRLVFLFLFSGAIKLLEFSWTENSLWRKSLSGSVYSSRNMKNRSARPWALSQDQKHPSPSLSFWGCSHFLGRLFYEIFIDELWFLFAALHVTLYAAVHSPFHPVPHTYADPYFSAPFWYFFVGKFNYFKMICAHINKK